MTATTHPPLPRRTVAERVDCEVCHPEAHALCQCGGRCNAHREVGR